MTDTHDSRPEHPNQDVSMPQMVDELVRQCTATWWESDTGVLPLMPSYTRREQLVREAHLQRFLDALTSEMERPPRTESERLSAQERIASAFDNFARPALDLEKHHVDLLFSPDITQAAIEFAQTARRFDPAVSDTSIFQASRNAWSMYGLQMLLGQPVQLTPAIFAFSMIYPYTDNYLDDPTLPTETKTAFNERLAQRLAGEELAPRSTHERIIWNLVGLIEDQFERACCPEVFESLLAIHRAQCKSLFLIRGDASPYETDVLGISLEKGGTSVLVDGYLVAGSLDRADREFMFGFGAFLQLVDDLQDVEQDRQAGLLTIFSQTAGRWPLDGLTNHTLTFGAKVLERLDDCGAPGLEPLKELMKRSTNLLLIEAAGQAGKLHTQAYIRELEARSPVRFSFLHRQRQELVRHSASLTRLLTTGALSPDAGLSGLVFQP